jgi:diaminopimelate epimerase
MQLRFFKYQGTGNDFIMVDNRTFIFNQQNSAVIQQLCHRRFGIGADGLILLENHSAFDFQMIYFNADGRQGSMCGNGGRCIVQFAHDLGVIKKETTFIAADGEHDAFLKNGMVCIRMGDVDTIEENEQFYFLNTGSPHYVAYVKDIGNFPVYDEGYKIRNNERFKAEGTNVNFVERKDDLLWVRTFERGVEDETFSCGTGVTAAALTAALKGSKSPLSIQTLGGNLEVSFTKEGNRFRQIYLSGPAIKVFEGFINI